MTSTSIKVPSDLRDRLNAEARRERTTVAGVLENLLAERERADRFRALRTAIEKTSAEDADSYRQELDEWDRVDDSSV